MIVEPIYCSLNNKCTFY